MTINSQDAPLVQLRAVCKIYKTAAGDFRALDEVSADFQPGEFVAIVGKSGAGKSTLVNMITAVDRLSAGQVLVNGAPIHELSESRAALWRGRNLGVVYQSFELLPTVSLLDNVMLPMDFCGLYQVGKSRAHALELLTQVGLAEHVNKPPTRISGGQQQRVAIARALANDPPILVADEPTGNLDSVTADQIVRLFEELAAQGKTVIMVTHDETLAARAQRTLRLADGRIVDEQAKTSKVSNETSEVCQTSEVSQRSEA
jgi:putative ABC transport system ATP-binding protein